MIANARDHQQKNIRGDLLDIFEQVITKIEPLALLKNMIALEDNILSVGEYHCHLQEYENIFLVGAGKATYQMAQALESVLGDRLQEGYINIPFKPQKNQLKKISCTVARHPLPDTKGMRGTEKIKTLVEKAGKKDLVIGLWSGGGSALFPLPTEDILLSEKRKLTQQLLKSSAPIQEINALRKHLSQVKGGQLAKLGAPAHMLNLFISDTIDDPLDGIASGPTAPDSTTFQDCIDILQRHKIWSSCPSSIQKRLQKGVRGEIEETPKESHTCFEFGENIILANHNTAVQIAAQIAREKGYHVLPLTSSLQGEAREVVKVLVSIGKQVNRYVTPLPRPALIIAGGETTVHVRGKGKGGRNQELVLSGLRDLQPGMTVVSVGTDGVDGITPEPVAGAIADSATMAKAQKKKLDIEKYLENNDAYHFFDQVNELIKTGPTGTNLGDLIMVAVY